LHTESQRSISPTVKRRVVQQRQQRWLSRDPSSCVLRKQPVVHTERSEVSHRQSRGALSSKGSSDNYREILRPASSGNSQSPQDTAAVHTERSEVSHRQSRGALSRRGSSDGYREILRPASSGNSLPCILSAAKYLTDSQEARCPAKAAAMVIARSFVLRPQEAAKVLRNLKAPTAPRRW
jgi:hypothetical protein